MATGAAYRTARQRPPLQNADPEPTSQRPLRLSTMPRDMPSRSDERHPRCLARSREWAQRESNPRDSVSAQPLSRRCPRPTGLLPKAMARAFRRPHRLRGDGRNRTDLETLCRRTHGQSVTSPKCVGASAPGRAVIFWCTVIKPPRTSVMCIPSSTYASWPPGGRTQNLTVNSRALRRLS